METQADELNPHEVPGVENWIRWTRIAGSSDPGENVAQRIEAPRPSRKRRAGREESHAEVATRDGALYSALS